MSLKLLHTVHWTLLQVFTTTEAGCSQEEGPKKGFGVQDSGCPGNIRKMYIGCPHPHRPEPGGMGHMEQGHSELFWVARALQLTPGTVI